MTQVNILSITKEAWQLTLKNSLVLIGMIVCIFITAFIFQALLLMVGKTGTWAFVLNVFSLMFQLIISLGLIKLCLAIIDGKEPEFRSILPGFNEMVRYLIANMAIFVIVLLIMFVIMSLFGIANPGFMQSKINLYFLIFFAGVPLLVLSLRFQFASYLIVDKQCDGIESLIKSFRMTKGMIMQLIVLIIAVIVINIIGLLALVVGLLITIPMSLIMVGLVYRKLAANYFVEGSEFEEQ